MNMAIGRTNPSGANPDRWGDGKTSEKCTCRSCGYTMSKPSGGCSSVMCPRCGGRMSEGATDMKFLIPQDARGTGGFQGYGVRR